MLWNKENKTATVTKQRGDFAEQIAAQYLAEKGMAFIASNVHSRQGEIDLIMKEQETFVFIEVKYRNNKSFGGAIAAIPYKKQQKVIKTATFYLQQQGLKEYNTSCRFDVVAIDGDLNHPEITWLKNAFD